MTRDTRSTFEEKLRAVWIERNGTGTDACSTCRPPHICAWHEAMIDDIRDLIKSDVIGENTTNELFSEQTRRIMNGMKIEQRAIVDDGRDNT